MGIRISLTSVKVLLSKVSLAEHRNIRLELTLTISILVEISFSVPVAVTFTA